VQQCAIPAPAKSPEQDSIVVLLLGAHMCLDLLAGPADDQLGGKGRERGTQAGAQPVTVAHLVEQRREPSQLGIESASALCVEHVGEHPARTAQAARGRPGSTDRLAGVIPGAQRDVAEQECGTLPGNGIDDH
jgi:hypothetical protein